MQLIQHFLFLQSQAIKTVVLFGRRYKFFNQYSSLVIDSLVVDVVIPFQGGASLDHILPSGFHILKSLADIIKLFFKVAPVRVPV